MSYELTRLFYRARVENLFRLQGSGEFEPATLQQCEIKKCESLDQIPSSMHRKLFRIPFLNPMRRSLIRGEAYVLLAMIDDRLAGFAWVQPWNRFRSRYGTNSEDAVMLGPDWVDPKFRGRGLHPLLIKSRLDALDHSTQIFAAIAEGNTKSESGYKKNGFVFEDSFFVRTLFCVIHSSRRIDHK